ncbi:hypothetical protein HDU82_000068 [Entophlyctis luteolus]|nr:hypothetical protein HDU82_000068 [Entophlyctis luteolus]
MEQEVHQSGEDQQDLQYERKIQDLYCDQQGPDLQVQQKPAGSAARYNPHSNRGRRKQTGESSSLRAQQMRDAQRALRARKQNYLLDLESQNTMLLTENESLKQQLSQALGTSAVAGRLPEEVLDVNGRDAILNSGACFNPNCLSQIENLQLQVLQLQSQLHLLSMTVAPAATAHLVEPRDEAPCRLLDNANTDYSHSAYSISALIGETHSSAKSECAGSSSGSGDCWLLDTDQELDANASVPRILTAEDLYGPVTVEPYLSRIKALRSLSNFKAADRLFDLFIVSFNRLCGTSNLRASRSLLLKHIREQMRIRDICHKADLFEFFKIFSEFQLANTKHDAHIGEICRAQILQTGTDNSSCAIHLGDLADAKRVAAFRQYLQTIPQLAGAMNEIDYICAFWLKDGMCQDDEFYALNSMIHSLGLRCDTINDKARFWQAFEIVRDNRKKEIDDFLASIEAVA